MNSFELNKIAGAILGTLLFIMGVGFLAEAIYHPVEDNGPGYALPEPEVAVAGAPVDAAPAVSVGTLLASASVDRGAAAVRKCQACHNFNEGEPNKSGPYLYDIVGATKAHADGFAYSDILNQQKAEGQVWSYENLDAFLENPKGYAPGTKMSFAGVKSAEERADILAYLSTLSGSPVPFPEPEATDAAAAGGDEASNEAPAEPESAIAPFLADARADRGANAVRKCQACHNFAEGEGNKSGPYLYDIVGAPKAHAEGYAYSDILLQQKAEGQVWTYDNLDAFLENPRGYAPGTKMAFAGVKTPEERADILAYLQTLSADPVPFPGAANAGEDEAAEGDTPAATPGEASPEDTVSDELTTPAQGGSEETVTTTAPAAVETPTETQSDTNVVGTPVQETDPAQPLSTNAQ